MSKRRRHANWPYRIAWLSILGGVSLYVLIQTLMGAATFAIRSHTIHWDIAFVSALLDATIATWFVAVGACVGSFLNVVAYRLPLGRGVGGHSSCPYCCVAIERFDNVPVLGWLKIRGRCRVCRLPISVQYLLVELAVALTFGAVYVSEFLIGGGNLPGVQGLPIGVGGMARSSVSVVLAVRLAVYAWVLSGLVAAALIVVRRNKVPLTLYLWCLLPVAVSVVAMPSSQIIRWRKVLPEGVDVRLDALATVLCGCVAGIAMARLLAPLLFPGFDRSLMSSDQETSGARQFVGGMAVAGALVGWQSVVPLTFVLLLCAIIAVRCLRRFGGAAWMADLTVWVWLGLLCFRAFWQQIYSLHVFLPDFAAPVVHYTVGALATAPLAIVFCRYSRSICLVHNQAPDPVSNDDEDCD